MVLEMRSNDTLLLLTYRPTPMTCDDMQVITGRQPHHDFSQASPWAGIRPLPAIHDSVQSVCQRNANFQSMKTSLRHTKR